jgi:hypothetical protein
MQARQLSSHVNRKGLLNNNHKNTLTRTDTDAHRSVVARNNLLDLIRVPNREVEVSRQVVVRRNPGRKNSGPKNGEANARACLGRTFESSAG